MLVSLKSTSVGDDSTSTVSACFPWGSRVSFIAIWVTNTSALSSDETVFIRGGNVNYIVYNCALFSLPMT